jgi:hypothetical protein
MQYYEIVQSGIERMNQIVFQALDCITPIYDRNYLAAPISDNNYPFVVQLNHNKNLFSEIAKALETKGQVCKARYINGNSGEELVPSHRFSEFSYFVNTRHPLLRSTYIKPDITRDFQIIFHILDEFIPQNKGSYLAGPISTGLAFHVLRSKYNVSSLAELEQAMGKNNYLDNVRWPNVKDGDVLAEHLRSTEAQYLINTGPLFIHNWQGNDYMKMCYKILEHKVTRAYFHPDWAYSSGAVEEYIFCFEKGIALLDAQGTLITLEEAWKSLTRAKDKLAALNISTNRIESQIARIENLV